MANGAQPVIEIPDARALRAPGHRGPSLMRAARAPLSGYGMRAVLVASLVVLMAMTLGTLGVVALRALTGLGAENTTFGLRPADLSALRFTIFQAVLSALISCFCGIFLARALARRAFVGRSMLITLLGAPFILPVIVAVLGLLAIFGRSGLFNKALEVIGFGPLSVFGLPGILLVHVFFNLPLATRLILQAWAQVPAEQFRLAASLGFGSRAMWRHIEWRLLRRALPGAFVVIFVICMTSFTVALMMGGGPKATTVELAIYQAFRFDFDLGRAASLGLVQFGICAICALIAILVRLPEVQLGGMDRVSARHDGRGGLARICDAVVIIAAVCFLLLPLVMLILRGFPGLTALDSSVWWAAVRSIIMAAAAAILAGAISITLALGVVWGGRARPRLGRSIEIMGYFPIAASPLVMGTGLYLIAFQVTNPTLWALQMTVLVNALVCVPFCLRALIPAVAGAETQFGRVGDALGLRGFARLRVLIWPRITRPMGFGMGLSAALSMGDLGVIALFGDPGRPTLPLQIYRLMGAYRMEAASAAALLLVVLSLGLFFVFDRGGRMHAET